MSTLLSAIIGKFTNQIENVATESLAHILQSSKSVENEFSKFLSKSGFDGEELPLTFTLETQYSDANDHSIPDLCLSFTDGRTILIEVKFWAKLTENQPTTYLKKLDARKGDALFFLVPSKRISFLKRELLHKLSNELNLNDPIQFEDDIVRVQGYAPIVLLSWEDLVNYLKARINDSDTIGLNNLRQLNGLIDTMLNFDFIPYEYGDMDFSTYQKQMQLIDLIDECVNMNASIFETKKLSYGGGKKSYQRWFEIYGYYTAGLELNEKYWRKHGQPIWFVLYGSTWKGKGVQIPHIENTLIDNHLLSTHLEHYRVSENGYHKIIFPIKIPFGKDLGSCVKEMNAQMMEIIDLLPSK
jgi:hypothetical protein